MIGARLPTAPWWRACWTSPDCDVSLRRALTADLPLKLTSLVLSVFLWFLAEGEEPARVLLPVGGSVRPPAGRRLVGEAGPVQAIVTGTRRELLKLSAAPMRFTRVLPDTTVGDEVQLEVGPGDLELPRGVDVHVQDVRPRTVAVELDSTFQRVVPVRAAVRLQQKTGHVLSAISVVPGTVRLLGPREDIRRIDSARTQPLELAQADATVEETLALDTAGFGHVRLMPAQVTVRVEVEPV